MDSFFKSFSSSSNGHNIDENIPKDLPKTPPLPTLSSQCVQPIPSQSVQPIPVDNSIHEGNNDYMYVASLNMRRARTLTHSIIFTILPGADIIQSLVKIACARSIYVSVVFGEGFVSEFDIGFPGSQSPLVKVSGYYRILTFSGTCDGCGAASFDNVAKTFNVSLVSSSGEIMGGLIITSMKAASCVTLVASTSVAL